MPEPEGGAPAAEGGPPPPQAPVAARARPFHGCLGFFLGTLVGFFALMLFVGVAMSGRNMEGRPWAVLMAGAILGFAIWGAVRLKRRRPELSRLYHGALIGLAVMGLLLGFCVAISFS
jgi:hypothetical protein